MDQGVVGSIFTVVVFVAFIGACWWAFSGRNKNKFDEAANLIFDDEVKHKQTQKNEQIIKKDQES